MVKSFALVEMDAVALWNLNMENQDLGCSAGVIREWISLFSMSSFPPDFSVERHDVDIAQRR